MFVHIPVVGNNNLPRLASSEFPAIEAKRSGWIQLSHHSPKLVLFHSRPDFLRKSLTPQHPSLQCIQYNPIAFFSISKRVLLYLDRGWAGWDSCLDSELSSSDETAMHLFRFKLLHISSTRWANHFHLLQHLLLLRRGLLCKIKAELSTKQIDSLAVLLASWDLYFKLFCCCHFVFTQSEASLERCFIKFQPAEVFCSGMRTGYTRISRIKFYSNPIFSSKASF